MDFADSSHRQKWMLTREQVEARRLAANKEGIAFVRALRVENGDTTGVQDALSLQDEEELVSFYVFRLSKLASPSAGKVSRIPRYVCATAVTYLRRFYLDRSVMEHDPLRIAPTCLYIAGKSCESYLAADAVSEVFAGHVKAREVLALEAPVLAALAFDLHIFHPYLYIDALVEEHRAAADAGDADVRAWLSSQQPGALLRMHKLANSFAESAMRGTAPLVMPPQQLALCSVCHALANQGFPREQMLSHYTTLAQVQLASPSGAQHELAALGDVRQSLELVLSEGERLAAERFSEQDRDAMKALDMKLRAFNPAMNAKSAIYKKLKDKEKSKKKRKRGEVDD